MTNPKNAIYLKKHIQAIEDHCLKAQINPPLMVRAAKATTEFVQNIKDKKIEKILVLVGPGNNGLDAILTAFRLRELFYDVSIIILQPIEKLRSKNSEKIKIWSKGGGSLLECLDKNPKFDLIIDGLFGIGLNRELSKDYRKLVDKVNACKVTVLSIDTPSGVECDTGRVMGSAIKATYTITFLGHKFGLLTNHGPDYTGKIIMHQLAFKKIMNKKHDNGWLVEDNSIRNVLDVRAKNSHKGKYGTVLIIGGAEGMIGAPILSGRSALKIGAGKVILGMMNTHCKLDANQPDIMIDEANTTLNDLRDNTVIVIGPGLSSTDESKNLLRKCIASNARLVIDAGGLTLIGESSELHLMLQERKAETVLTPHPGEAAILLKSTNDKIQNDRLHAAIQIAKLFNCLCILKGCGTVISDASGNWHVNVSGNPGMATAGMGDVLAGFLGGLLAQGANTMETALSATRLHGLAAERLAEKCQGYLGITASEIINPARTLLNEFKNSSLVGKKLAAKDAGYRFKSQYS